MDFSKQAQRDGQRLITEGEADQQVAACMGSEAEMQAQIGMIKQDLGCRRIGEGVAAQLGVGVIKCMLELMKGNGIEPWDFFR